MKWNKTHTTVAWTSTIPFSFAQSIQPKVAAMDKAGVMDPVSSLQRWLGVPVTLFVFFSKKEMKSQKKKVRHSHAY